MNLLRCATHTVADVAAAVDRLSRWFDYSVAEQGVVPADLAASWGTPASAGKAYALCRPASGAEGFVRFVEGTPVDRYKPIRTYGWAATDSCGQDVLKVNEKLTGSPFEVIGPPTRIPGLPTIFPMQVKSPEQEIIYLTEITTDAPDSGLPKPRSLIDTPFILVLACRDMVANLRWFQQTLGIDMGTPMAIRYSMIAKAFGLPLEQLHEIVTGTWENDVFVELDQYPDGATVRECHPGALPPGVSICTLIHPKFDTIEGAWIVKPVERQGPLYGGRRVGVLRTPEGALIELIDGK